MAYNSIQIMAGQCLQLFFFGLLLMLNTHVHGQPDFTRVNITIPADAVAKGAVCLDGSPAGYHYGEGFGDGANSWMIFLPGGGWCHTEGDCRFRVKVSPVTATTYNMTSTYFGGIMKPDQTTNPDFYNWNRVSIRYCDGSSFIGDVEEVNPETNLHYRGSRIFSLVVEELLSKGLENAQNVILVGSSAGGLATIVNCDRFRAMVPNAARVKCIADSAFFILGKDLPNADQRELYYAKVVQLHGIAKFLPEKCTSRMDPGLCFFPENLVGDIETPLFLLNSAFDMFQISRTLKPYPGDEAGWASCTNTTDNCTTGQLQVIKDFKNTFLETLKNSGCDSPSRGLFINSCYIHDHVMSTEKATQVKLDNKNVIQALGDWFFDRSIVKMIDTQSDRPKHCVV